MQPRLSEWHSRSDLLKGNNRHTHTLLGGFFLCVCVCQCEFFYSWGMFYFFILRVLQLIKKCTHFLSPVSPLLCLESTHESDTYTFTNKITHTHTYTRLQSFPLRFLLDPTLPHKHTHTHTHTFFGSLIQASTWNSFTQCLQKIHLRPLNGGGLLDHSLHGGSCVCVCVCECA